MRNLAISRDREICKFICLWIGLIIPLTARLLLMSEMLKEVGSRLKEMRELSRVNAEDMADHLKMPVEKYSCYENGLADIPASTLIEIARKLDVDTGLLLTGQEPKMNIFTVTRAGEGVEMERRKQHKYVSLAGKFIHKKAEPFIVTIEPHNGAENYYSHPGQEFEYVLLGTLKIHIHDHEIVLNEGDSIFFDSSYKHAMVAMNDRPVKLLAVVM
jgi:transcriptional regulator with XRE-family HTH domain